MLAERAALLEKDHPKRQRLSLKFFSLGIVLGICLASFGLVFFFFVAGGRKAARPQSQAVGSPPGRPAQVRRRLKDLDFDTLQEVGRSEQSSLTTNAHMSFAVKQVFQSLDHCQRVLQRYFEQKKVPLDASKFFIMSVSALWLPELQKYLAVGRMHQMYRASAIYATMFDADWQEVRDPVSFGSISTPCILDIPVRRYEGIYVGPEEPRLARDEKNEVYLFYNQLDADERRKMFSLSIQSGSIRTYYLDRSFTPKDSRQQEIRLSELDLEDTPAAPFEVNIPATEKGWTPMFAQGRLLMVYNHLNFQLYDCTDPEHPCKHVQGAYDPSMGALKGCTPYVRFRESNFLFGIGYTHLSHNDQEHSYRPCLILIFAPDINDPSTYQLVDCGKVITFSNFLSHSPHGDGGYTSALIVPSIARIDHEADVAVVTVGKKGRENFAVKIKGMLSYVERTIGEFEGRGYKQPPRSSAYYASEHRRLNKI